MHMYSVAFLMMLAVAALTMLLTWRDSVQYLVEFLDIRGLRRLKRKVIARAKFSLLALVILTGIAPAVIYFTLPILVKLPWTSISIAAFVPSIAGTLLFWSLQDIQSNRTHPRPSDRRDFE